MQSPLDTSLVSGFRVVTVSSLPQLPSLSNKTQSAHLHTLPHADKRSEGLWLLVKQTRSPAQQEEPWGRRGGVDKTHPCQGTRNGPILCSCPPLPTSKTVTQRSCLLYAPNQMIKKRRLFLKIKFLPKRQRCVTIEQNPKSVLDTLGNYFTVAIKPVSQPMGPMRRFKDHVGQDGCNNLRYDFPRCSAKEDNPCKIRRV